MLFCKDILQWDNNGRRKNMANFPDVNPKYDEILFLRQVSREQWGGV